MRLSRLVTKHRNSRVGRQIIHWAHRVIDSADNVNNLDWAANGELTVLQRFSDARCVFDVGANRGEWAEMARTAMPAATIHCFEIVPATAKFCAQRFAADDKVQVVSNGLGDRDGTVDVSVWSHDDRLSSVVFDGHAGSRETIQALVTTGDSYVAAHAVDTIDLLKIDAEGAEPAVLRGFATTLAGGRIGAIQFEFGMANLVTRFLLADYYALLGSAYAIGRMFPDGVEFRDHDPRLERFELSNYLAVRRDRPALIERLAVRT